MLVVVSFDVVSVANNVWAGKYTKPLMFPKKVREGGREERRKRREDREKREERRERREDR